jgi:hypothetical protein
MCARARLAIDLQTFVRRVHLLLLLLNSLVLASGRKRSRFAGLEREREFWSESSCVSGWLGYRKQHPGSRSILRATTGGSISRRGCRYVHANQGSMDSRPCRLPRGEQSLEADPLGAGMMCALTQCGGPGAWGRAHLAYVSLYTFTHYHYSTIHPPAPCVVCSKIRADVCVVFVSHQ